MSFSVSVRFGVLLDSLFCGRLHKEETVNLSPRIFFFLTAALFVLLAGGSPAVPVALAAPHMT